MNKKHPQASKSIVTSPKGGPKLKETEKKKMELGEAMEHEHGQERERIEKSIENMDGGETRPARKVGK